METFPNEIWIDIFYFLQPKELLTLSTCSRHFYELANSNLLWKELKLKRWKNKHTVNIMKNLPKTDFEKIIYFSAERDSKRTKITKEEFCSLGFEFKIVQDPNNAYYPIHTLDGKYLNDGVAEDDWTYELEDNEYVRCNNFPKKQLTRTQDWGWFMSNPYSYYTSFSEEIDQIEMTTKSILEYSEKKKQSGNEFYKQGEFWKACNEYRKSLMYLGKDWLVNKKEFVILKSLIWSNLASCYIQQNDFIKGMECTNTSLYFDPKNAKSLYRKAYCMLELNYKVNEAKKIISYLLKMYPESKEIKNLSKAL
eukprot:gene7027-11192_t